MKVYLRQMDHNYIRPHMTLDDQSSAEKCGIKIEGDDKWITLVQNASKKYQLNTFINLILLRFFMLNLRTDLIARVCIITSIYSIISYFVIQKNYSQDQLAMGVPMLFVMFGIVILISILYDLRRYHVTSSK